MTIWRSTLGEKDILEKGLLEYDDVYMDIVKVLLSMGEELYDEPERLNPCSIYKDSEGRIRKQERDVFKALKKDNIRFVAIGIENQSDIDYYMPFRIISYDGAAYKSQLSEVDKGIYPVISIVLYFGNKHWTGPRKLSDKFEIPLLLKPYFNDYKVNVFEISYLTEEQVKLFESDFGILADFFVQKRKTGEYIPSEKKIVHKEEFIMLMSVLTGDKRYQSVKFCEGGEGNMCEILDYYIGVGEKRGEKRGYELGEKHGLLMGIRILLADGYTVSEISQKMKLEEDFVEELLLEEPYNEIKNKE